MASGLSGTVDRIRQPEYTGENRCIPCTTVNVVIAAAVAAGAAVLHPALAVVALVASLSAIYLRGYLVPGTPTLTKRYFPDWLLAKFDKGPAADGGAAVTDAGLGRSRAGEADDERDQEDDREARDEPVDPERLLVEHGVVEPCVDEDDLCLDADVRDRWRARMDERRNGDRADQVADFLEVDATDTVSVRSRGDGDTTVVRVDGRVAARWESDAALIADLAAVDALADRVPDWDALPLEDRSQVASGLRAFVEACPACGGPISIDESTVESCCRSREVYAITCEACETRILEVTR